MICLVHAANVFFQSHALKFDTKQCPLAAILTQFTSISLQFWIWFAQELLGFGCGVAPHDLVKFQWDLDEITRDIRDFVDTVDFNEMEVEENLQSDPVKLKSSHWRVDAGCIQRCVVQTWKWAMFIGESYWSAGKDTSCQWMKYWQIQWNWKQSDLKELMRDITKIVINESVADKFSDRQTDRTPIKATVFIIPIISTWATFKMASMFH